MELRHLPYFITFASTFKKLTLTKSFSLNTSVLGHAHDHSHSLLVIVCKQSDPKMLTIAHIINYLLLFLITKNLILLCKLSFKLFKLFEDICRQQSKHQRNRLMRIYFYSIVWAFIHLPIHNLTKSHCSRSHVVPHCSQSNTGSDSNKDSFLIPQFEQVLLL